MFLANVRNILTLSSFSSSYIYLDPPNTTKKLLKVLLHYGLRHHFYPFLGQTPHFFASPKGSQPSAHSAPARARCSSARYTARAHQPGSAAGRSIRKHGVAQFSPGFSGTFGAPKYDKIWQNNYGEIYGDIHLFTQFLPHLVAKKLAMIWSKPAKNG